MIGKHLGIKEKNSLKQTQDLFSAKGNGNPLPYSCLENPMDRGAWRATVCRVPKSWTWLKQLSTWHTHSKWLATNWEGALLTNEMINGHYTPRQFMFSAGLYQRWWKRVEEWVTIDYWRSSGGIGTEKLRETSNWKFHIEEWNLLRELFNFREEISQGIVRNSVIGAISLTD